MHAPSRGRIADAGAGNEDDHDDLAVRITAVSEVPLPAPLALLIAFLTGMGLLSFRRREAEA